MKLLRSLYALGLPPTSKELRSVEQEVRWRMRRLKYKHLAFLAESSANYMQEQDSQELLAELLVQLERRWAEINDSRVLVAMMMKTGHLSESLMTRLEDKVLRSRALAASVRSLRHGTGGTGASDSWRQLSAPTGSSKDPARGVQSLNPTPLYSSKIGSCT